MGWSVTSEGPQGPLDLEVSTAALPSYNQTSRQFQHCLSLYPQTKVGDILDSGPSRRRRRRRRRRNFLVDAITQKQINIFFSNLVHMLRVPKGRSLF